MSLDTRILSLLASLELELDSGVHYQQRPKGGQQTGPPSSNFCTTPPSAVIRIRRFIENVRKEIKREEPQPLMPDKDVTALIQGVTSLSGNRERTGREVDLEGHVDDHGYRYLGKAYEMSDGTWRCLAVVNEMLMIVEVKISWRR